MATSIFTNPRMRWAVPAGVTAAIVAAAVAIPLIADADPKLEERTAAEILMEMATAEPQPFSGEVVHTADMGLPELPGLTSSSGTSNGGADSMTDFASSVLSGSTTARIWFSDESRFRVALQDDLVENDLVVNGTDVWLWSSSSNDAAHLDLSAAEADDFDMKNLPGPTPTPAEVTEEVLSGLSTTDVEVDGTAKVAGRDAYELIASPTVEGSLIDSVRLAVDGEHFAPLRVQVFSTADANEPAVEVGFTSVTFSEPDESVFEFEPPEGATVEELDPSSMSSHKEFDKWTNGAKPDLVGEGWTSVLVVPDMSIEDLTSATLGSAEFGDLGEALLSELKPVSGPYGTGVVFETDLVTAMLLDDGRLLVGPVTLDVLEEAATT